MTYSFLKRYAPYIVGIIFAAILIALIAVMIMAYSPTATEESSKIEPFSNRYSTWSKELKTLKDKFQLGMPSGVLKFLPKQSTCPSNQNLFVQPNVTFRPTRRKKGCTYIDMQYA